MYNWSLRMKGIKYGAETMLVEIIAIFSNLKDISPQIQEVLSTPSSIEYKKAYQDVKWFNCWEEMQREKI